MTLWGTLQIISFASLLFATLVIGCIGYHKTNMLFKTGIKIYFISQTAFYRLMHTQYENENVPMRGKRIAAEQ